MNWSSKSRRHIPHIIIDFDLLSNGGAHRKSPASRSGPAHHIFTSIRESPPHKKATFQTSERFERFRHAVCVPAGEGYSRAQTGRSGVMLCYRKSQCRPLLKLCFVPFSPLAEF
jgi:hypothetical protein